MHADDSNALAALSPEQIDHMRRLLLEDLQEAAGYLAEQCHEAHETVKKTVAGTDAKNTFERMQKTAAMLDLTGWNLAAWNDPES